MLRVKKNNLTPHIYKDSRGWVANPIEKSVLPSKEFGHIHIVSIEPNALRGNHYHNIHNEWAIIFGGKYLFAWFDREEDKVIKEIVEEDSFVIYEIPLTVPHVFKNIDQKTVYLMAYYDHEFDSKNPDMIRYNLI
ncbi:MAG: cupin domain-containing protein [bacterium]|nr:cupin domain-containing protein [bacterium]